MNSSTGQEMEAIADDRWCGVTGSEELQWPVAMLYHLIEHPLCTDGTMPSHFFCEFSPFIYITAVENFNVFLFVTLTNRWKTRSILRVSGSRRKNVLCRRIKFFVCTHKNNNRDVEREMRVLCISFCFLALHQMKVTSLLL